MAQFMNLYKKFSFRIRHHIIRDNPNVRDQLEKKMIKKFCILKDRNGSGSVKVWGYFVTTYIHSGFENTARHL